MSLALFALFFVCIVAQATIGWRAYRSALGAAHMPTVGLGAYLGTGHFLDGIFSNWQAALLQLAVLIAFGTVLRQKGAPHSRLPGAHPRRTLQWKLGPRETAHEWLRANSLSLAFIVLFVVTFALHAVFGHWAFNEDQALRHLAPEPLDRYVRSAEFWDSVFKCWEAEFFAIGTYVVLSIFLRQENSPESKPVDAPNSQTGGAKE